MEVEDGVPDRAVDEFLLRCLFKETTLKWSPDADGGGRGEVLGEDRGRRRSMP